MVFKEFPVIVVFFQRDIGSVTPCDMILLKTPLLPGGKGQTNHADDACEKFVCPNLGPLIGPLIFD